MSALVCVAGAAVVACSTGESTSSTGMSVDTVGGIVHVRHTGDATEWSLRELAAIGGEEGPSAFGRVRSIAADGEGNVYVADVQASEIRVFAPDGSHLRTFGRKGAGPGEFTEMYSIAWMGDTLAVLDPRAGRISLLSRTGEWIGQLPHAPNTGPDIRLHTVGRDVYGTDIKADTGGKFVQVYVRYSGGAIDTLAPPQQQSSGPPSTILCRPQGGGLTFFRNPYVAQLFQSPAPGKRFAIVSSAVYRIDVVGADGDTAMVIEKQHQPATISDTEWEDVIRPHREWATVNPGVKCDPVEFTRPAGKPALRTVFFDDAERMWVEVVTANGNRFDVFDAKGAQVGYVRAPERQRSVPPYVRGDRLFLVTVDSLDVQSVRAFRIER